MINDKSKEKHDAIPNKNASAENKSKTKDLLIEKMNKLQNQTIVKK